MAALLALFVDLLPDPPNFKARFFLAEPFLAVPSFPGALLGVIDFESLSGVLVLFTDLSLILDDKEPEEDEIELGDFLASFEAKHETAELSLLLSYSEDELLLLLSVLRFFVGCNSRTSSSFEDTEDDEAERDLLFDFDLERESEADLLDRFCNKHQ